MALHLGHKGAGGALRRLFECLSERDNRPNRWALHDLGLAVGNLTTQASSLDLYVHIMGGFSVEKARRLFDLPVDIEPITVIAVGYLGDPEQLPADLRERETARQQRKSQDELMLGDCG